MAELFERKRGAASGAPPPVLRDAAGREAKAYVKPPRDATAGQPAQQQHARVAEPAAQCTAVPSAPPPKGRARKAAAAAAQAAAAESAAPGSAWRGRVVNCLSCGRVHDCRGDAASLSAELRAFLASNACAFCGEQVTETVPPAGRSSDDASAAAAAAAAARLVTFDRQGVARSRVIDDQSDYVSAESNPWLSEQERAALRAAADKVAADAEARKRRVTVTIDLVGRRVLSADEGDDAAAEEQRRQEAMQRANEADAAAAATAAEYAAGGGRSAGLAADAAARLRGQAAGGGVDGSDDVGPALRMMSNPTAPHTPVFVSKTSKQTEAGPSKARPVRQRRAGEADGGGGGAALTAAKQTAGAS